MVDVPVRPSQAPSGRSPVDVPLSRLGFGQTARTDSWWISPAITFAVLGGFVVYATWAALQGEHYAHGNYLSPFYSPELFGPSPHAIFGPLPAWMPAWITPAVFILWAPGGFRFTCYYYRGAYYKAFWADPPACAVGEPRKTYLGERSFPLIFQNVHRYFLYLAIPILLFLAYDAWRAMWFVDGDGVTRFGVGVGTLVLCANAVLLGGYTLGCHSFRHLVGGVFDRISERPLRRRLYHGACSLNGKHMLFAWCSLIMVAGADLYVRLCSMGIITDARLL